MCTARGRPPRAPPSDMAPVDLLIVAGFVVYAIGAGLRNRRAASRTLDAYFLADRRLPGVAGGPQHGGDAVRRGYRRCWSPA